VIDGGRGDDTLFGHGGNDQLDGGPHDDIVVPGAGNDAAVGGGGFDAVTFSLSPAGVDANLESGNVTGEGDDTIADFTVLEGTDHDDVLAGSSASDVIYALAGSDEILGRGGNDALVPGTGDDTVVGGGGFDLVSYFQAAGGVTVDLGVGVATGEGVDLLSGIWDADGSSHADTLLGGSGVNFLYGRAGNDTLRGMGSNDVLFGDVGNDLLDGGAGNDRCLDGESHISCETIDQAAPPAAELGERAALPGSLIETSRALLALRR
jgi:Ca2+-binding RTX toxin-like protein